VSAGFSETVWERSGVAMEKIVAAILLAGAAICLVGIFSSAAWSLFFDFVQNRKRIHKLQDEQNKRAIELSGKLRRTRFDLSLSRRQVDWREVLVARVDKESADVNSYYLIDPKDVPLPCSQPGQHILLERPAIKGLEKDFRCYSLSDDCLAGYWRISVKKNSNYPGSVSRWLHEEVSVGEILRVRGPSGAFFLRPEPNRSVVLASAGVGITPMLPMILESIRRGIETIQIFAQFRDVAHMPFAESLLNLAEQYPKLNMNIWVSHLPKRVNNTGTSPFYEGKFQASHLIKSVGNRDMADFYLCGPEAWQSSLTSELVEAGIAKDHISFELFQEKERKPVNIVPRSVHFKSTGTVAQFENSFSSLLGCASKNQVALDSGCRTGACGSCAVRLLQGRVRYTRTPQYPIKQNEILPCVCIPETDLVIDA
jgi:uncharacterized protein